LLTLLHDAAINLLQRFRGFVDHIIHVLQRGEGHARITEIGVR
jgi:hypothetical protein